MTLLGRSPVASLDALAAACSRGIIVFINTVQLTVRHFGRLFGFQPDDQRNEGD